MIWKDLGIISFGREIHLKSTRNDHICGYYVLHPKVLTHEYGQFCCKLTIGGYYRESLEDVMDGTDASAWSTHVFLTTECEPCDDDILSAKDG